MKLFVWDFHGVLEKDNEKAVIDISNQVLAQAGFTERFTEEDNERFYGLKWYQYFERLLPKLTPAEHMALQAKCFEFAEKHLEILAKHIKPNDHAIEVLKRVKDSMQQQIVISNSRQSDLLWFLDAVGIKQFFDEQHILGVNAHQHHATKTEALKHFLQSKQFDRIIVVGDSEDDIQLGNSVGATTYFYKHPHRVHQLSVKATHTISDLRKILQDL